MIVSWIFCASSPLTGLIYSICSQSWLQMKQNMYDISQEELFENTNNYE